MAIVESQVDLFITELSQKLLISSADTRVHILGVWRAMPAPQRVCRSWHSENAIVIELKMLAAHAAGLKKKEKEGEVTRRLMPRLQLGVGYVK